MKRFIIAVIMLILVFAVCIAENVYLKHTLNEVSDKIENIETAFYSGITADHLVNELTIKWHKNERFMELFLDHSTIDEITTEINKLEFLSDFDRYQFANTVNTLHSLIEDIKSSENISIDGLF